ncbi:MAG: ABC transporter ATP-binding protein [Prochlorotrichaceae cyanobacterium]
MLATHNLSLGYPQAVIIEALNLAIPPGKITAIVGANGCGKSTLLRGLARLLHPDQGAIYLEGKSLAEHSTKTIAKSLGILLQNTSAPEGLTVKELVKQGRYPHQSWLQSWGTTDEDWVQQALQMTNLKDLSDRTLETLSGGQRQRAWIALLLAQNPKLLLLDEPTTFLDIAHQVEILDLLYALNRQQERTIVMVLHDLNQACRYADCLIALKDGQVVAMGEPKAIVNAALVQQVFNLTCQIYPDPLTGAPLCLPVSQYLPGEPARR